MSTELFKWLLIIKLLIFLPHYLCSRRHHHHYPRRLRHHNHYLILMTSSSLSLRSCYFNSIYMSQSTSNGYLLVQECSLFLTIWICTRKSPEIQLFTVSFIFSCKFSYRYHWINSLKLANLLYKQNFYRLHFANSAKILNSPLSSDF